MAGEYTDHHTAKDRLNGAIKAGNIDALKSMIDDGISAVDPDDYGMRPLFYACQHASVPIVSLLAQHKADLDAPVDRDAGRRPLYYAAESLMVGR